MITLSFFPGALSWAANELSVNDFTVWVVLHDRYVSTSKTTVSNADVEAVVGYKTSAILAKLVKLGYARRVSRNEYIPLESMFRMPMGDTDAAKRDTRKLEIVVRYFSSRTGSSVPSFRKGASYSMWIKPIEDWLEQYGGDIDAVTKAIDNSVTWREERGLKTLNPINLSKAMSYHSTQVFQSPVLEIK